MADLQQPSLQEIRHSAEHVLTQAMHRLYGPDKVVMAMGPATENGFYFDFETKHDFKISEDMFGQIETEMFHLINSDLPIIRHEVSIAEARKMFADNPYKQEWLDEIESRGEQATVYWTGEAVAEKLASGDSFVDLCKGPHVQSTKQITAVKLLSIAGAYWHGDEHNQMLTRIYGTAFGSKEALKAYLFQIEEAKKRDHRKLGKELDLFTFSDLVGAGLPLWTPKGTMLRNLLDEFVWQLRQEKGYQRVTIPHITKKDLYVTSGHWGKYADDLFKIQTREGHEFAMKPMNCPHHTQIYAHLPRSYRDLPQRYAETTMVYRDEQTGELNGLSRVRCITQDDAHVFCRENQLKEEFYKIWDIIEVFYKACGFPELEVRLSLHDPAKMENYLGEAADWENWENQLRSMVQERDQQFVELAGEAAFYGPKIDFMAKDSLGREWQVATIQADRNMPTNFDLSCTNEAGEKERIVMIHAAIMGSIERFLSILIEHYAGKFPVWLSPVQVKILPIADRHQDYARQVEAELLKHHLRCELDTSAESLSKKIRTAQKEKVPYMLVLGDNELEQQQLSIRDRAGQTTNGVLVDEFVNQVREQIQKKS